MSAPRFFVDGAIVAGTDLSLDADDAHHVSHVLRLRAGDAVVLLRDGVAWDARITEVSKGGVRVRAIEARGESGGELPRAVTVVQAMVKGNKFDDVVEKCVELGARRIVPVLCERSYAQAGTSKLERWRRIARAAAAQSRRLVLPVVDAPMLWNEALAAVSPLIVAWEGAPRETLGPALAAIGEARHLGIAVGPEGSFTGGELDAARAAGARLVSLGPTILRTETAAAALLAAIASRAW